MVGKWWENAGKIWGENGSGCTVLFKFYAATAAAACRYLLSLFALKLREFALINEKFSSLLLQF